MGVLPQALEIIFEVEMKGSNEKIARRNRMVFLKAPKFQISTLQMSTLHAWLVPGTCVHKQVKYQATYMFLGTPKICSAAISEHNPH
jgi:hypothetical protein